MFEPRLSHVQIEVTRDPKKVYGSRAAIVAAVTLGEQLCRVNFDVVLDAQSAQVQAAA